MSSLQEQLNQVPWEQLSHPYRAATEIPTHLFTLLSHNAEEWQSAFDQLDESLCTYDQCFSITEASCAAVPFLILLLQEIPDQRKLSLLRLLSELAGQPRSAHRERMVLKMDHHGQETRQRWQSMKQFSQEWNSYSDARWAERAHQLVGEGLPTYLSLLHSAHEDTVRGTLELFGRFQDLSEVLVPVVVELYTETASSLLKVLALHCLSDLLDPHSPEWEMYHQAVTTPDVHPMVRSVAARELALDHPDDIPPAAVNILAEEMLQPHTFNEAPGEDADVPGKKQRRPTYFLDCRPLSCLGVPMGVQGLISALEQGAVLWSILDSVRVAEALLDVAFFGCWVANRFWSYRTVSSPFLHIDSLRNAVSNLNPDDPYFDKDLPDLDDDNAYFLLPDFDREGYSQTYTNVFSDFFIEVAGYDRSEAERLKQRFEQEGSRVLLDHQKDALRSVLRCEPLWQVKHNLLEIYGLPTSLDEVELSLLKQ